MEAGGRRKSKSGDAKQRMKQRQIDKLNAEERMILALELGQRNELWLASLKVEAPKDE